MVEAAGTGSNSSGRARRASTGKFWNGSSLHREPTTWEWGTTGFLDPTDHHQRGTCSDLGYVDCVDVLQAVQGIVKLDGLRFGIAENPPQAIEELRKDLSCSP